MIDIRDYSDKYLAQYAEGGFETVLVRVRRARVLESLARYPHRHILEVGCGLEPLFVHVDAFETYTIVEPAEEFANRMRAIGSARAGVEVVTGFLEEARGQLADRPFDFVVVSSLLHEVEAPDALLAAVRAVCGPETVVHFNVPNVRSFHRLLAYEMGLVASVFEQSETERRFQRHTRFDMPALRSALEGADFDVLDSGSYFVKPFTHAQMERMLVAGIIDDTVLHGLSAMTRYMPELGCEIFVDARRRR